MSRGGGLPTSLSWEKVFLFSSPTENHKMKNTPKITRIFYQQPKGHEDSFYFVFVQENGELAYTLPLFRFLSSLSFFLFHQQQFFELRGVKHQFIKNF